MTQVAEQQLLEPLSRATETLITPLEIFPNDFLFIGMDKEAKRFVVQAKALSSDSNACKMCRRSFDAHASASHEFQPADIIKTDGEEWSDVNISGSLNASQSWVKKVPERKESGHGGWLLAATDITAIVIYHQWPDNRLVFEDELAEVTYRFLLKRFFAQTKSAVVAAQFKVNKESPLMPKTFIDHPDLPLTMCQRTAVAVSCWQEAKALFMEQGTGKTAVSVSRVCTEARRNETGIYRVLVLCPGQVRLNWKEEFQRFSTIQGKVSVLRGGNLRRTKQLVDGIRKEENCRFGICVMSIDSVDGMVETLKRVPWDLIIIDESHYIKNQNTKRFKAVRELVENSRQRMILTGTPIANKPFDLWAQLEFLGAGLSGFLTFANFRKFHGIFKKQEGTPIARLIGLKGVPLIQERLARLAFMVTKKEAGLDLPDKVYDICEVEMTPKQRDVYKQLATQLIAEIENDLATNDKITADHILTKMLRLAQVTSGFVRFDTVVDPETGNTTGGAVRQLGDNPKINEIVRQLTDEDRDPKGKTIIWSCHVEDIRALSERLSSEGIKHVGYHKVTQKEYRVADAREAEQAMNKDPECRVFLGNPASAAEGLNILGYDRNDPDASDMYVDHEIYMGCNWNAVQRSQSEDRAHRRGTRMPVRITDLVVPGTIDEEIRARVLQKQQVAASLQDVRKIMRNLV